ncbi:MAG TPA: hypothetical protein RMF84_18230 [Polyangiaceae bacterium LLY-WYZ-14_1]|nr:hypothetical protein [Polyangiaceae bacterium LLY-WYZ-14_1]
MFTAPEHQPQTSGAGEVDEGEARRRSPPLHDEVRPPRGATPEAPHPGSLEVLPQQPDEGGGGFPPGPVWQQPDAPGRPVELKDQHLPGAAGVQGEGEGAVRIRAVDPKDARPWELVEDGTDPGH